MTVTGSVDKDILDLMGTEGADEPYAESESETENNEVRDEEPTESEEEESVEKEEPDESDVEEDDETSEEESKETEESEESEEEEASEEEKVDDKQKAKEKPKKSREEREHDWRSEMEKMAKVKIDARKKDGKETPKVKADKETDEAKKPVIEKPTYEYNYPKVDKEEVVKALESSDGNGLHTTMVKPIVDYFEGRIQHMVNAIPEIMAAIANDMVDLRLTVSDFYQANPDLVGFKSLMELVSNELQSEHPDWAYNQLIEETGKEVRRRLNLHKQEGSKETKKKAATNSFVNRSTARKPKPPKLTGMEADIEDLMKHD